MFRSAVIALLLVSTSALAQTDPRLAEAIIKAQQAMLILRDTEAKVMKEDFEKRIEELLKLCGDPCKDK